MLKSNAYKKLALLYWWNYITELQICQGLQIAETEPFNFRFFTSKNVKRGAMNCATTNAFVIKSGLQTPPTRVILYN